jgi:hypothetical protein
VYKGTVIPSCPKKEWALLEPKLEFLGLGGMFHGLVVLCRSKCLLFAVCLRILDIPKPIMNIRVLRVECRRKQR